MAYNQFNPATPAGTQTGTAAVDSMRNNLIALRDSIIGGFVVGFTYAAQAGNSIPELPQFQTWSNGALRLRATNTWSGTFCTQTLWEFSSNSGGSYDPIVTEVRVYDINGNLTTTTGSGGIMSWLHGVAGRFQQSLAVLVAHLSGTGSAVHGLGTISTQNANAVAISGGAIDNTLIGGTTPAEGRFSRATEQFDTFVPTANQAVALNWAKGGATVTNPPSGSNILSFGSVVSNMIGTFSLFVSNFNNITWPASVTWGVSGKPSIAGAALVQLISFTGGTTVLAVVVWRAA